jgi:hypothetical protein
MQCYTIRLFLQNALHVSDSSSAHHQELKLHIQHRVFVKLLLLPFSVVEELFQLLHDSESIQAEGSAIKSKKHCVN